MWEYRQKSTQKSQLQVAATNKTASYNPDARIVMKIRALQEKPQIKFPDLAAKVCASGTTDLLPAGNEATRKQP